MRMSKGGDWWPIWIGRNGPRISHMMFTDDLLHFAEAPVTQMKVMRTIEYFCVTSGYRVSATKIMLYFLRNVSIPEQREIQSCCNYTMTDDLGRYLSVL